MRILHVFVIVAVIAAIGCKDTGTDKSSSNASSTVVRMPVSSKLDSNTTQQLISVVTDYYALKNALVATKAQDGVVASKRLAISADELMKGIRNDSLYNALLKPYLDTIVSQSNIISAETDPKCERQRLAFSPLSNNLFSLLKAVDIKNAGVYKQYCPMAFNDKGAYWLSSESEIKNPYFGKKMLECGEVQDSL